MTDISIRDLAIIGDRRTAALIARDASVVWYCPGRFDGPSVFGALLDAAHGGRWSVELPGGRPAARAYLGETAILETHLETPTGPLVVTDWMPMGGEAPSGAICRSFSPAPAETRVRLHLRPDYNRERPRFVRFGRRVIIQSSLTLHASHPIHIDPDRGELSFAVPKGERAWALLADVSNDVPDDAALGRWRDATIASWNAVAARVHYSGPYEREVAASLRAVRLLTYEKTGGIIAAATTSLPETIGGTRNYDYRYVWTRDAGMVVSALLRAGSDGTDELRFLDFICSSQGNIEGVPVGPIASVDGGPVPAESVVHALGGYRNSRPVNIGNGAHSQLQLDALGNVLLAAKLLYEHTDTRPHWSTICHIAEFLAERWREPDFGIWEERETRSYTVGKVIAACGLEFISPHAPNGRQAKRWRSAASDIRAYVAAHCLTAEGAYAAVAGGQAVDLSAVLFPVWSYTPADAPAMIATVEAIERTLADDGLYRRHLELADSASEGVFLAGTLWVAQYWIMRGALDRARGIIDAVLRFANDVGLFAEEGNTATGEMLGNFPQTFVHAAFIGAVLDLKAATAQAPRAGGLRDR